MKHTGIVGRAVIDPGKQVLYEAPVRLASTLRIQCDLKIGAYTYLRGGVIRSLASIGRYCSIAPNLQVGASEHPTTWLGTTPLQYSTSKFNFWMKEDYKITERTKLNDRSADRKRPVIGSDVWIGANVVIRLGVRIGHGAILAANSVVVADVPAYTIVGGVPAKPIRRRFPAPVVRALLESRWWQYDMHDLSGISFDQVELALEQIAERVAGGMVPRPVEYVPYVPELDTPKG